MRRSRWRSRGSVDRFHRDVDGLGLIRPDAEPRVSDCIGDIQDVISKLIASDHAYASEGTVWFAVKSDDNYGCLSGQNVDELRSPDEVAGKRHPADFALWKAVKPGEPSWPSPWGDGRPGGTSSARRCRSNTSVLVSIFTALASTLFSRIMRMRLPSLSVHTVVST